MEQPKPRKRIGRPPLDAVAKTSRMVVRVAPSTLEALEQEANRHQHPVSREIEARLVASLAHDKDARTPTRALAGAFEMLEQALARETGKHWHEDPQTGAELAQGIDLLVRHYAKANEVAPTGKGNAFAGVIIAMLEQFARMEPLTPQRPGATFPVSWLHPWQIALDLKGGSK